MSLVLTQYFTNLIILYILTVSSPMTHVFTFNFFVFVFGQVIKDPPPPPPPAPVEVNECLIRDVSVFFRYYHQI